MDQENIIEIVNMSFSYDNRKILFKGLNFSLKRGDKVGIIGSNGTGKSTLFHIIMGLIKPIAGELYILGKKRQEEADFFEVRKKIGLLFQDSDDQLFCPTVEEDIAFGPLNLGKKPQEIKTLLEEIGNKLGLDGMMNKVTYKLSGGEKKLVAFATVVSMQPECLLLDEPTAGLDEQRTEMILKHLTGYYDSYIVISHDYDFLRNSVKKIYTINDGQIKLKEIL
ncbi:MAG: energy-coupling factor ABC transporter ATP-binding protein [Thermodesulfovibrionales bacterium]|nr:energy-coupling factor ABC transporter ATP-binding protein [Thermodesulfovibrionales bacterium]